MKKYNFLKINKGCPTCFSVQIIQLQCCKVKRISVTFWVGCSTVVDLARNPNSLLAPLAHIANHQLAYIKDVFKQNRFLCKSIKRDKYCQYLCFNQCHTPSPIRNLTCSHRRRVLRQRCWSSGGWDKVRPLHRHGYWRRNEWFEVNLSRAGRSVAKTSQTLIHDWYHTEKKNLSNVRLR